MCTPRPAGRTGHVRSCLPTLWPTLWHSLAPALALLFGLLLGPGARAEEFPAKPLRLIVPFPPGGPIDQTARTMSQKMAQVWNQPVVIDNRTGGNGAIAADLAAHAPADGYTLLFSAIHHSVLPSLSTHLGYNIETDFDPVTLAAVYPIILVARQGLGVHSVAELIAAAKLRPGSVSFGHSGYGGGTHLAGELFRMQAGIELLQVPYKGSAPAMAALLGDQVDLMFSDAPTALPHVKTGRVIALGISTPERSALLPSLPTIIEGGLPGYNAYSWGGISVPAGTPPDRVRRLNRDIVAVLQDPETRERLLQIGAEPHPGTPQDYARMMHSEIAKWAQVVRQANIHIQ